MVRNVFQRLRRGAAALVLAGAIGAFLQPVQAASPSGGWQIYSYAHGLSESDSYQVMSDGAGGLWVGHVSGGRGVARKGGLSHIPADGNGRELSGEPFSSCSSVDALALAPDKTLWLKLSGYHDYGSPDYQGRCTPAYGAALGYIAPGGSVQMIPPAQEPSGISSTDLVVDSQGRPWVGTERGLAVREASGTWREVPIWGAEDGATAALFSDGATLAVGSARGAIATVNSANSQVTVLPHPTGDRSQAVFDLTLIPNGVAAAIGNQLLLPGGGDNGWQRVPLPAQESIGHYLAYAGGRIWAGAPAFPTGLFYYDVDRWIGVESGSTPLPSSVIHDLVAESATSLLIATSQGVARLDTSAAGPDPRIAQDAFTRLWERTNRGAGDSWVWGPFAWAERYEPYKEGPGGTRFVRYYDKARMELPQPGADPTSPWYVTNGLLVVEMVRGQIQQSDDPARGVCPYGRITGCPASLPVAGDTSFSGNGLAPTYGEFAPLLAPASPRTGQRVATTYTQPEDYATFELGENAALASADTTIATYDDATDHNIPQVFWDYMNRQPTDWLFAFGHPIAEPVWVRTKIGGVEQWVLVQLFERRTLTYTPANDPAWQVEMGNVGQHYYAWRYSVDTENPIWAQPLP